MEPTRQKNNSSDNEKLRTKANFICITNLLEIAERSDLTGKLKVEWDASNQRMARYVEKNVLPGKMLTQESGDIYLSGGRVIGARIGTDGPVDLGVSLNALLRVSTGIGCGVQPSTTLTLIESENALCEFVGSMGKVAIFNRTVELEKEIGYSPAHHHQDTPEAVTKGI